MFEECYTEIKNGYNQSWYRFIFKYSAIGKLLEQNAQVSLFTFYETYLSLWWFARVFFWSCLPDKRLQTKFTRIIELLQNLKTNNRQPDP